MPTLLFEIGLEEMPARYLPDAERQLKKQMTEWLDESRITYRSIECYSTPRRLAILAMEVSERQADLSEEVRGPARRIAQLEDGEWSKAALGFAKSQGVSPTDLTILPYKGEDYVFAVKRSEGELTKNLLPNGLEKALMNLSFSKKMRWGDYSLRFARPIRWIVCLFDEQIIPFEIAGVKAGRESRGHRFLGGDITLTKPEQYEAELLNHHVIVDREARKQLIESQIRELAKEQQWEIPIHDDLLNEVTDLVEHPQALFGSFEPEFLDIPEQVLITSMREHQRYFPVRDHEGKLLPYFVTVRNGDERSLETVSKGNEKVLRARLADARFFYQEDQKMPIESANEKLKNIVFHEELGTVADKTERIVQLAVQLAQQMNMTAEDISTVRRGAEICKFDLVTQMVNEFPELQGVMGEDYARNAGEPEQVASVIVEHYQPAFSGDASPASSAGALVAIADKIDTLAGCFAIGIQPTGSQDPYALRRHASGIVQVLLDHALPFTLEDIVRLALDELDKNQLMKDDRAKVNQSLLQFFGLRVKHLLLSRVRQDVAEAVMASGYSNIQAVIRRADALNEFVVQPNNRPVLEAFKRVQNLAAKAEEDNITIASPDPDLFEVEVERHLHDVWHDISIEFDKRLEQGLEADALESLSKLREVIPQYFDQVMVMAEKENLRHNRLFMLAEISTSIQRFADFHQLTWKSDRE